MEKNSQKVQNCPRSYFSQGLDGESEGETHSYDTKVVSNEDPMPQESKNSETEQKEQTGSSRTFRTYGMDVKSTIDDRKALHVAFCKGQLSSTRTLLEGDVSQNKPDAKEWTPKALAEQQGSKFIDDLVQNYEIKSSTDEHKVDVLPDTSEITKIGRFKPTSNGPITYFKPHLKNTLSFGSTSLSHATDAEVFKFNRRRVTIHMKFLKNDALTKQPGKLIILPDSIEELFRIAGKLCSTINTTNLKLQIEIH